MNQIGHTTITMRAILIYFLLLSSGLCRLQAQMVLTYDQSLATAKDNSPNIRRTRLGLERSRELLKAQQAALKSHFSLTLNPINYSQDRTFNSFFSAWSSTKSKDASGTFTITQPIELTDGTLTMVNRFSWQDSYSSYQDNRNKSYTNDLSLRFNQPIFTYNRTKLQTRGLELDLERNQLEYSIQELSLELQVAQNFFNVYRSKMNLDIGTEEQKNQEASYQIIQNKVAAGLAPLEDLYQAELNLETSKSTVLQRQVTLENNLDNFKRLIGIPLAKDVAIEADVTYREVTVNLDQALRVGLEKRMELRQNSIDIENAMSDLIVTEARNEFKGAINLTYGIKGDDERFSDLFSTPRRAQTIGLSFDIPVWDWGEKRYRIQANQASITSQKVSLEDQVSNITIQIRQTFRTLQNNVVQIDIAQKSVRNAQLTYDINLERYKNGDLNSMDLNRYQSQLSSQKMGLVGALIDYKLALLQMKIQSLWDFENNQPVIP